MTDNEDRIDAEHARKRDRPLGEGLKEGSPEWWAERAKRHDLPADQVVVLGRIEDFDPTRDLTDDASAVDPDLVPPEELPDEDVEDILESLRRVQQRDRS